MSSKGKQPTGILRQVVKFDLRILEWMIAEFKQAGGFKNDKMALQRLKEAAEKQRSKLSQRSRNWKSICHLLLRINQVPKHFCGASYLDLNLNKWWKIN